MCQVRKRERREEQDQTISDCRGKGKEVTVWERMNRKRLNPLLNSFSSPLTNYISFANYTVQVKQPGLKSQMLKVLGFEFLLLIAKGYYGETTREVDLARNTKKPVSQQELILCCFLSQTVSSALG